MSTIGRFNRPPLPLTFPIREAIKDGFYQCRKCNSLETHLTPEGSRRCTRCQSYKLKFHPGIGD